MNLLFNTKTKIHAFLYAVFRANNVLTKKLLRCRIEYRNKTRRQKMKLSVLTGGYTHFFIRDIGDLID